MKRSWLERNPNWKIPLGCLTLLLLIGIFATVVIAVVMTSFHRSDVYQQAMAQASANLQVREQIGEPIEAAWFMSGQLNVNGDSGPAKLTLPISGPRRKARSRAVASKNAGGWRFTSLQVNIEGQDANIDVLSVQPPPEREF